MIEGFTVEVIKDEDAFSLPLGDFHTVIHHEPHTIPIVCFFISLLQSYVPSDLIYYCPHTEYKGQ